MQQSLSVGLCWKNKRGVYLGCNKYFANMLGLSNPSDIIDKIDEMLPWKEQAQSIHHTDDIAWTLGEIEQTQEILTTHSGLKTFLVSKNRLINEQGDFFCICSAYTDITSEKKEHDGLSTEDIFYNLPGFIYWKNKKSEYVGFNKNVVLLSGLSREQLYGKTDQAVNWGRENFETFQKNDQVIMETGIPIITENTIPIKRPDGQYIVLRTEKTRLLNKKGDPAGILGVAIDITDEKMAVAKMTEAKITAEAEIQLRQIVTILAASIAHDLRTPIAIISMSAKFIQEFLPPLLEAYRKTINPNPKILKNIEQVSNSFTDQTKRMSDFINVTLKTLSKASSGELSQEDLIPCKIGHCIKQAVDGYPEDEKIGEQGSLIVDWDHSYDFQFMGNDVLMVRILFNLIKNSLYQIKKNGKGKIFIYTEEGKNMNMLKLKDTAGGAPKAIVENLFEGFKTNKKEGTGVGLAFCKQIMKNFGGDITCHSIEGEFIEFVMSFPKIS